MLEFLKYAIDAIHRYIGVNVFYRAYVTPVRLLLDNLTMPLQFNGLTASGIESCRMDVGLFDTTIDDRNYGHHTDSKGV